MIQIRFLGRGNTRLSARQFGLPLSGFSIVEIGGKVKRKRPASTEPGRVFQGFTVSSVMVRMASSMLMPFAMAALRAALTALMVLTRLPSSS